MIHLQSLSNKWDFRITRDRVAISDVMYNRSWFSKTASARVNTQTITIKHQSIWRKSFLILKDGKPCGEIRSNWSSKVTIALKRSDRNGYDKFIVSQNGWFLPRCLLKTEAGDSLLRFDGKFNWRTFKINYKIVELDHHYENEAINELLVYSGFAVNLSTMNSGWA